MKHLFENWNNFINENRELISIGPLLKSIEDSGYPESEFASNQEMPNGSYAMNNGNYVIRDSEGTFSVIYAQDISDQDNRAVLSTLKDAGYQRVDSMVHDHPDVYKQQLKASGMAQAITIDRDEYKSAERGNFTYSRPGEPEYEADIEILKRTPQATRAGITQDPNPRQQPPKLLHLGSDEEFVYAKMSDGPPYVKVPKQ
jgi:hypothetical protein